jgi:hypothetical protein
VRSPLNLNITSLKPDANDLRGKIFATLIRPPIY